MLCFLYIQATAIIHTVGIDKLSRIMAMDNEEVALATCNLVQTVYDFLSVADRKLYGKEEALVLGKRNMCFQLFDRYDLVIYDYSKVIM